VLVVFVELGFSVQCAFEMTWAFAWRDSGSRDEFSSFLLLWGGCMEMWWEEIKKKILYVDYYVADSI